VTRGGEWGIETMEKPDRKRQSIKRVKRPACESKQSGGGKGPSKKNLWNQVEREKMEYMGQHHAAQGRDQFGFSFRKCELGKGGHSTSTGGKKEEGGSKKFPANVKITPIHDAKQELKSEKKTAYKNC